MDDEFETEEEQSTLENVGDALARNRSKNRNNPKNSIPKIGKKNLAKPGLKNDSNPNSKKLPNDKEKNDSKDIDIEPEVNMDLNSNVDLGEVATSLISKKAWLLIIISGATAFFIILVIAIIFLLENSDTMNYATGNYYANEEYRKLYGEIDSVAQDYKTKYGVTIDKNLIVSVLTAYQDNSMYFDSTESGLYEEIVEVENREISKMTAMIEILAKYQIKTVTSCSHDSSTIRQIARNDDSKNLLNFLASEVSREKNYDCSGSSGTQYVLSTEKGNLNDDNSGSTFYWNLIDEDFLKEYYPEYFGNIDDPDLYRKQAAQVVDYMYLYSETLDELSCDETDEDILSTNFSTIETTCSTVTLSSGDVSGTYRLEEYVAGIISKSFPTITMNSVNTTTEQKKETLKAYAIAVRSYVVSSTNGCKTTIMSSSDFAPTDDPLIWTAINETTGMVLTKSNTVISAEYDSYAAKDYSYCDDSFCNYEYTRIPGTTTINVTIPREWYSKTSGGDGKGLSAWGAYYQATTGKKYQEIVLSFYDEEVEIQQLKGTTPSKNGSKSAYCRRAGNIAGGEGTCNGTSYYGSKKIGEGNLTGISTTMTLLACTADQAELAFEEIASACGPVPHAGSMRSLNAEVNEARSAVSFHYTGRAFDLHTGEGMQSNNTYFYVTHDDTSGNDNSHYYRLYCKVQNNTESSHIKTITIIPLKWSGSSGKPISKSAITDTFLDVTEVFNKYGLYGIGPRKSCMEKGNYMCTEWWHFQDTSGLVKGQTTFRDTLYQYYGSKTDLGNLNAHLNKKWNGGTYN